MQNDLLPEDQRALIIKSDPIELVLSEEGGARLTLILPPFEDLSEIKYLTGRQYSLKEHADKEWAPFKSAFADELTRLEKKNDRFGESRTYFSHLANLAELAGDRPAEFQILGRVPLAIRDNFFQYRLGENLHAQGRLAEAEKIFSSFDLDSDASANLRLAYFHAQKNQLDLAAHAVSRVLGIDPLNYGGRLFEGALRLARGECQAAIQSFRIAESERPTSSVLYTNLAIAYLFLKKDHKALASLRKAVALDPLNHNAVSLLADVAHAAGRDEDAVPALRYFVNFEQRVPSVWGRLARSLLQLGHASEALAALRHQATHEDTSAVWNNIGVAHVAARNRKSALSAFKHSTAKVTSESIADAFLALRNILAMLVEDKNYDAAIRMAKLAIREDRDALISKDSKLSDIYTFYLHSLRNSNRMNEAVKISERLLESDSLALRLRVWIGIQLLSYYATSPNRVDRALSLANEFKEILDSIVVLEKPLADNLINNLTFAYAETGHIEEATALLPYLSKLVHEQPYPTATLGLIHLRKGHIERAIQLYEEAIHIALKGDDKKRIRQKLNLELGLNFLQSDAERADRFLKKAEDERHGSPELSERARALRLSGRNVH